MPKARAIVATTNPKTGEPIAAGAEVDLDDESYNALRAQGALEASDKEVAEHAADTGQAGEYHARTTRADTGQAEEKPAEKPPEPEGKKK